MACISQFELSADIAMVTAIGMVPVLVAALDSLISGPIIIVLSHFHVLSVQVQVQVKVQQPNVQRGPGGQKGSIPKRKGQVRDLCDTYTVARSARTIGGELITTLDGSDNHRSIGVLSHLTNRLIARRRRAIGDVIRNYLH
jgi:hypothetical protein